MQCPVCKADNDQGPQCRRCRADLAALFALAEQRGAALAEAYRSLARGQWQRALAIAEGAHVLRSDEETRRLLAVVYLMRRNFALAWEQYRSG